MMSRWRRLGDNWIDLDAVIAAHCYGTKITLTLQADGEFAWFPCAGLDEQGWSVPEPELPPEPPHAGPYPGERLGWWRPARKQRDRDVDAWEARSTAWREWANVRDRAETDRAGLIAEAQEAYTLIEFDHLVTDIRHRPAGPTSWPLGDTP